MSNVLSNGTVLPHGLLKQDSESLAAGFNRTFKSHALKAGVVTASYPVSDKRNITKLTTEYDIVVIEQDENRAITPIQYKNCVSADGLGSIADYFEKQLRTRKTKQAKTNADDLSNQDGAVVLILCLDGSSSKAIVIGALTHPNRKTNLKDNEQAMYGEFNGVAFKVLDDGSVNVTFKGATNNDGSPKDPSQGNTAIDIEKDGSFQVAHSGVTARLARSGDVSVTAKGNIAISNEKDVSISSKGSLVELKASDAKTSIDIKELAAQISGSAIVTAQSVKLVADTTIDMQAKMLKIDIQSIASIAAPVITLDGITFAGGSGGLPALTLTAKTIGIGNLGAPVVSTVISGFATKVFVT